MTHILSKNTEMTSCDHSTACSQSSDSDVYHVLLPHFCKCLFHSIKGGWYGGEPNLESVTCNVIGHAREVIPIQLLRKEPYSHCLIYFATIKEAYFCMRNTYWWYMHVSSNPHRTAMKGNLAFFSRKTEEKDEKSEVSESYLSEFVISTAVIQYCALDWAIENGLQGTWGCLVMCIKEHASFFIFINDFYSWYILEIPPPTNSNIHTSDPNTKHTSPNVAHNRWTGA